MDPREAHGGAEPRSANPAQPAGLGLIRRGGRGLIAMATGTHARSIRGRSSTVYGDPELRRFLAREIHDGVTQTLTTLLVEVANFRADQKERCDVTEQFEAVEASVREVIASLRELVYNLRGEPTTSARSFMEMVAIQLNDFGEKTGIETRLTVLEGWPSKLKSSATANLRRIVGEALVNVRRHSCASHVTVAMGMEGDSFASIAISDDGRGFEPELLGQPGMGIVGMRERGGLLGGRLQIETAGGAGTTIRVTVPVTALTCSGSSRAARWSGLKGTLADRAPATHEAARD